MIRSLDMAGGTEKDTAARSIGRYVLFREIAHGGMATVHLGRLRGPAGFARTVAIKRLHPQFARDPEFVTMFLDEARMAARIQHPNVVSVLDVVASEGELFLVMDYVHGEALSKLLSEAKRTGTPVPPRIILGIMTGSLSGLHAAHEARSERGDPLGLVHRDVSPHNVIVAVDGIARLLDFGIAKATLRMHAATRDGQMKGKVPYMAPEQVGTGQVDRRGDVYAAGVILWEALTGQRLFPPLDWMQLATLVMTQKHEPPSKRCPGVDPKFDAIVMRGIARDPDDRFATALEMQLALEEVMPCASPREIGEWVTNIAKDSLKGRETSVVEIEGAVLPPRTSVSEFPRTGLPHHLQSAQMRAAVAATDEPPAAEAPEVIMPPAPAVPVVALPAMPAVGANEGEEVVLPMRRAPSLRMALAGGALLVVLLGAWGITCAASGGPELASLTSSIAATAASVSSAAMATPSAGPSPSSASTPSVAALDPTSAPHASSSATSTTSAPPRRPPARRADCNPPYTIDANGVKIPKRSCF